MENDINGSYFLFTLYFKETRVACVLRDNARPPCKAWKWEEREKGSVAAPASPPGANTETRDGKRGGGGTVGQRGRERWKLWRKREEARCALSFRPTIKSLPKLSSPLSSSPSLMAFTSSVNFLRMPAWSILRLACNVSRFLFFLTPVLQNQPPPSRRGAQREIKRTGRGRMRNK